MQVVCLHGATEPILVACTERTTLQFPAETFNLFKHPNFANPSEFGDPSHLTLTQTSSSGVANQMLVTGLSSTGVPGQLSLPFQDRRTTCDAVCASPWFLKNLIRPVP